MLPDLVPIRREQHFRRRFIPVIASELFIQFIYRLVEAALAKLFDRRRQNI